MGRRGWRAVDLDGTAAVYSGWQGPDHIGPPVPAMQSRIKRWLADGDDVRIFTARVWPLCVPAHESSDEQKDEATRSLVAIRRWCHEHIGRELPVTAVKDFSMTELYDDRAVSVEANTGRAFRCGEELHEGPA